MPSQNTTSAVEAPHHPDACPFDPGSRHQRRLRLGARDQLLVYHVLGRPPRYPDATTPR
jgi:hypothetical protein